VRQQAAQLKANAAGKKAEELALKAKKAEEAYESARKKAGDQQAQSRNARTGS